MADIEKDIKLLRDQVDALQIAANEEKIPWYRQTPSLVSVLALVGSIATFGFTQFHQNAEEIWSKNYELLKSLEALITIRDDFNTRVARITDSSQRNTISSLLNAKQQIYLSQVESLTARLGDNVPAAEFIPIAAEFAFTGRSKKAEDYYLEGLRGNPDVPNKVSLLSGLAMLYFTPGDVYNLKSGRKAYEDAVATIGDPGGNDTLAGQLGYTYQDWAVSEYQSGNPTEGDDKFQLARKFYSQMNARNPERIEFLQNLASAEAWVKSPLGQQP